MNSVSKVFARSPFQRGAGMLHSCRRDGRVDYCGCLENSWVNSPGGSNPSPSVEAMTPRGKSNLAVSSFLYCSVCSGLLRWYMEPLGGESGTCIGVKGRS